MSLHLRPRFQARPAEQAAEPKVRIEDAKKDQAYLTDYDEKMNALITREQWRVEGTLIKRKVYLSMEDLRPVPGLENLSAFKPTIATVFPVSQSEGKILWDLVESQVTQKVGQ